jgi:diaminohydroxyphosphoribosylaminopyrimidine deaminase/5-amino-6-(5-phosphoribosylamino)uracil reductase
MCMTLDCKGSTMPADFMAYALALARQVLGTTSPNPAVGAVVVREGQVIGWGATQPPGGPHAERVALAQAGERARGATLYVTLEPCVHYGRTPPCVEAIIAAGIAEVHVAVLDPNPLVNGRGVQTLKAHGIRVVVGEHAAEARRLNEWFFKYVSTGRPFVLAKYAMTLDGKIATCTGDSRWITGPAARAMVHRLRAQVDAVIVGVGTVRADDPSLTARPEAFGEAPAVRQPVRIVVDSRGHTPLDARVLSREAPTWIATTERMDVERRKRYSERGAEVLILPTRNGQVDLEALLEELGRRQIAWVMVEGGSRLLGSLWDLGLIDKVMAFIAPKCIGGEQAPGPIGGRGRPRMAEAIPLDDVEIQPVGEDWCISGYPRWPKPGGQPCSPAL